MQNQRQDFEHFLDRMLKATTQGTRIHGLKLIDIDLFRLVNQSQGFAAGNAFLNYLHGVLQAALLEGDRLFYLGEDSFVIVCPYRGLKELFTESHDLLDAVNGRHAEWDGGLQEVSCSIGVAQTEETDRGSEDVLLRAERGLYQAKSAGRGCVYSELSCEGEPTQDARVEHWARRLQHAFLHDGFEIAFEPLSYEGGDFSLTQVTLHYKGQAEDTAELRSELGAMDLLLAMDRWVLTKLSEMNDLGARTVMRLSPASVCAEQFTRFLSRLLAAKPELSTRLWFAVSEHDFPVASDKLQRFLDEAGAMGCHSMLIDFGSGTDSLSRLRQLPVAAVSPYPWAQRYEEADRPSILSALKLVADASGKGFVGTAFRL